MNVIHNIPDEQTFESMPDFEISLADPAPTRRESNEGGTGTGSNSHVSKPRRGRRRGTGTHSIGSTASTEQYHESFGSQSHDASASIGAISYESSECLFFDELASVVDLDAGVDDDDADGINANSNMNGNKDDVNDAIIDREITLEDIVAPLAAPGERRTSFGRRGSGLSRGHSSLSLKSVLEDEILSDSDDDHDDGDKNNVKTKKNVVADTPKLVIRRLEQRIVEKHIKTGRLKSVASMDQFGTTTRNADSAAGQRRIRTSLSFGSSMPRLSLETPSSNNFIDQPSLQGGGLRCSSLQKNDSFRSVRTSASDKSAASAGRRLLGM